MRIMGRLNKRMYHIRYFPELVSEKKKIVLILIIFLNTYTNSTMKTLLLRISLMRIRMRITHESIYRSHLLYSQRHLVRRDVMYYVCKEIRKDEESQFADRKEHPERYHSRTQHQDTDEDGYWFEHYTELCYT